MAKDLKEWWENESLINKLFVDPLIKAAQLPGQVWRGEVDPMRPTQFTSFQETYEGEPIVREGTTSQELLEGATNFAGTVPLAGLAAGARPAANTLFAGGWADAMTDMTKTLATKVDDPLEEAALENEFLTLFNKFKESELTKQYFGNAEEIAAMKAADEVPFYTGNPEIDKKIAEAGQLGWKEDYLTGLVTPDPDFDPKDLDWYLNPLNLKNFSASANAQNFIKPEYDPDALLKPKPLDTEKFPWLKKPSAPAGNYGSGSFDKYSPILRPVREQLYLRGMDQEPLVRMQELMDTGRYDEAQEVGNQLRALLPENWDLLSESQSTIVPHAIDTVHQAFPGNFSIPDEMMAEHAQSLGFDPENVLLRGTRYPTDRFLDPRAKKSETGSFYAFANDPNAAKIVENYGRYAYPVVTRAQNPLEKDFGGKHWGGWMHDFLNEALEGGHDMAVARNMRDEPDNLLQDQAILFDPALVRSIYAKFDPARLNENNLLASQVGGVNPFSWLIPEEEKKKQMGQYRF